jgi:PIN domain nuclease of toxin-antitoxin system
MLVSAATAWEISTKHRLGKLPGAAAIVADLNAAIDDQSFTAVPINVRHGQVGGALAGPRRDPFDRMLIAQAMVESLVLVSNEQGFAAYGVGGLC